MPAKTIVVKLSGWEMSCLETYVQYNCIRPREHRYDVLDRTIEQSLLGSHPVYTVRLHNPQTMYQTSLPAAAVNNIMAEAL